jgi:purine-binding chemotaxis protein CheW
MAQPDALERVLLERARRLGRAPREAAPADARDVLVCRVRDELYALELARLEMARPVRELTPVPTAPARVAGVMNVRGEVLTVLDLAAVLDLGGTGEPGAASRVVFVGAPEGRVGLLVDEVVEVRRLALDALERPLGRGELARGVADARIVLLDLDQLLAPGRLEVAEEVV